ncbi:MAG: glyoxylate/hydroxypyruvate reductase A [Rhizobacter sp.]
MNIIFHAYLENSQEWVDSIKKHIPGCQVRLWTEGDNRPADYLLVRNPPIKILSHREGLRAVFNVGAGADGLLEALRSPEANIPGNLPLIRLEDAGMASQMVDYVVHAVLHYFRRFDVYHAQQQASRWFQLPPPDKETFEVGILGLGVLGSEVAGTLQSLGFPVRAWRRSKKSETPFVTYEGMQELPYFLQGVKCLINLLPLTEETRGILNKKNFAKLAPKAYLINVARGGHLVEADLLDALQDGQLAAARLDVAEVEPLPSSHPFWRHPNISVTPHISAVNLVDPCVRQIAEKINSLERGQPIAGLLSRDQGY